MFAYFTLILVLFFVAQVAAFRPPAAKFRALTRRSSAADEGYGPFGSLTRQGPVPFFIRLAKPDTYEQAVAKYMLLEKCSRIEAQANMDFYFQDPNGWASNKLRERSSGRKLDYVNMGQDPSALFLSAVWATGFFGLCYRIFQVQVLDK